MQSSVSGKWKGAAAAAALALFASALSGCSGGSKDASDSGSKDASDGGASRGHITSSVYDRGTVPKEEGTMTDNRWTKWINENGPADVDFVSVPRWDSITKYNVMFASGSAPNVIFEFDSNFRSQLIDQKQVMPIDDLIDKYSTTYKDFLNKYPEIKKVATRPDGHMYEFGHVNGTTSNHIVLIRTDWLKKLGLDIPKTSDDLLKVATAFANQDPDGNGKKDTYGINLSFIGGMVVDYMFGDVFTIYEKIPWHVEDGKLVHDWDRTVAAFDFMKQLYDAGDVDKDFLADKQGEKAKQDWLNGKLGIYGTNTGDIGIAQLDAFHKNNPDAEFTIMELPEGPYGHFSPAIQNPVQLTAVINAKTKDPQAAMEFVDFMSEQSTYTTLHYGIEGETYEMVDGCPQITDEEKWKQIASYTGDLGMLHSVDLTQKPCMPQNPTPTQTEALKLKKLANEAYVSEDRPEPYLTTPELMPALSADMQLTVTNAFKTVLDNFQKSVVSGSAYTPEMALKDSQDAWSRAGGEKVDQWYADWYDQNKDTAFLTKDMYKFIPAE